MTNERILGVALVLAAAGVARADGPTTELARHARGETIARSEVQRYLWKKPDLSTWNSFGGSQNHPIIAAAAVGDYRWVSQVARLERAEGIFGKELGAPGYYFHMVVAAKMVALRDARRAGAAEDAEAIARSLRCVWAYESLVALETPRRETESNLAGRIVRGRGDAATFLGLTSAVAGERWHSEAYVDHDDHGAFLSWALDWTPRRLAGTDRLRGKGEWWYHIVGHLAERDDYATPIPPEPFGLTRAERDVLLRVVRGDATAARQAVAWVAEFGTFVRNDIRLRRTTEGTEVVWFDSNNGNKTAHAATSLTTAGRWRTIRPGFYRGVGANKGYRAWIEGGVIHAECAPGEGVHVSMPELGGSVLWEIRLEGRSVRDVASGAPPAAARDDAAIVRHTVPPRLAPGQSVAVEIVVRNTGTTTWTRGAGYRLGSVGDATGEAFALDRSGRAELAAAVPPGEEHVFRLTLTAPATPSSLRPSWRMLCEGKAWFGAALELTVDLR